MRTKPLVFALSAALAAASAFAADAPQSVYMNPADVKWGDAPPIMKKGAKMAVLHGDPGKEGPFVARLMVPANYKISPHWHSKDEQLTVVQGTLYLGEGDRMDGHAHAIKVGGFHFLPAKTHHYAYSKSATVVQINGMGPFDLNYVNDADDPTKAPMKK